MIIKDKFTLLKDVPNILSIPPNSLNAISIENGSQILYSTLELMKSRVNHFTKSKVFKTLSDVNKIHIVNIPKYILKVSYNKPTDGIVINLAPFGTDDILPNNPGSYNLYASLVYGVTFKELVTNKVKIATSYSAVVSSYLMALFLRMFGKQYGLLGSFSKEIVKLKFLTNCYVLDSFFGITGNACYKKASVYSSYDYRDIEGELRNYDFSNIDNFIMSLSNLKVLPGINKHIFTAKIMRMFGLEFLPAIEDLSRFISVMTTSNIKGSYVVPTFIFKYNEESFKNILEISKRIFK